MVAVAGVGPAIGVVLILLAKPLAGEAGIPGAVSGYIALTALLLGCATVACCLRAPHRLSAGFCGGCALVSGVALMIAGLVPGVVAFTAGVLLAGAAVGPALVAARALVMRGARTVGVWYAAMAAGSALGAALAGGYAQHAERALLICGVGTTAIGILLVCTRSRLTPAPDAWTDEPARALRALLPGYFAAGLALGHAVLPALHLLLFRWDILDGDHWRWMAAAGIATVAAVLPPRRMGAVPPLLISAAGGAVLIATAPAAWAVAIGLAVTLAAVGRALAALDDCALGSDNASGVRISAATALLTAAGGLTGLGTVAGVSRWWGTGSALTLTAVTVSMLAVVTGRLIAPGLTERVS
ncbi:hypothetical protein [Nocardia pseudobrasiliensis]|uniref:MFS transporter n=1 Tax=Nocardia pseudobrasiliensis TaxID=45979 RepID=A0A370HUF4_9NOCA|nr:hypothetical protein [Nocardia pseudobrasiliensis]RDI60574.1 hypothetical protein DFR76_115204 [Nocardia pseudobrasiliensis]